jgi:tRNA A37 threonylcarbamoyladenosine dehydratase
MKFRDPDYGNKIEDDDLNYVMMRWADVLLMKAEALNETDDASSAKYDCINEVRRRAGISDLSGLTKEQFRDAVLKERLLDINPSCHITALRERYSAGTKWGLEGFDVVIDAIDSLSDKAALILEASASPAAFFSSMGAACKIDPTKVRVAEFFSVRGCPLGSALRKKLRQAKTLPSKPFLCVYDDEVLPNLGPEQDPGPGKAVANGTLAPVTGIFGFTLAGLALNEILKDEF